MAIDRVTISGLTKRFGFHRALAGVDLTLRAGSLCALLGPNGAGKSTLLGILSTLVRATGGEIVFADGDTPQPAGDELRGAIGVLAHDSFVYGQLSGVENLMFYGRLFGVPSLAKRAAELLDQVGLDERARTRTAGTYSRGMTQRLSLARALLHDPQVLLLDEPFTGLDRTGSQALKATLVSARQGGRLILVVTHDLEFIGDITDQVAVLRRGKLVFEQARQEPFSHAELKQIYHDNAD